MTHGNRAYKLSFAALCCFWTFFNLTGAGYGSQFGKASWYAMTSLTASGERANPNAMTVAHRSLKFGTRILVTNLRNSQSVVLCVNDRGPFIKNRIVDVTKAAAHKLGFVKSGWTDVRVDVIDRKSRRCS